MTSDEKNKNLLKEVADNYVSNHSDSEVRRMYGHHCRSFIAGAKWQKEELLKEIIGEIDRRILHEANKKPFSTKYEGMVEVKQILTSKLQEDGK
jgi:hypothetical protein